MRVTTLAGVLALAVAGATANASVVTTVGTVSITVTDLGVPTDTVGDVTTYHAFKVTASTTDGRLITSVTAGQELSGSPPVLTGPLGFTGPMLQNWFHISGVITNPSPTESGSTGLSGGQYGIDSHFLIDPTTVSSTVESPTEDNNFTNLSGMPADNGGTFEDFGQGSSLQAIVGFSNAARATSVDIAYLVLPAAGGNFDLQIATTDGQSNFLTSLSGPVGGTGPIPEPASLGLLGLGSLLVLRRRRTH